MIEILIILALSVVTFYISKSLRNKDNEKIERVRGTFKPLESEKSKLVEPQLEHRKYRKAIAKLITNADFRNGKYLLNDAEFHELQDYCTKLAEINKEHRFTSHGLYRSAANATKSKFNRIEFTFYGKEVQVE